MRYPDWQYRFWAEMERQQTARFVWGERDCVLFAATVADSVCDSRYVDRARKAFHWSDGIEAAGLLADRSLQSLVETVLGPMQPWTRLTMGDIALVLDNQGHQSLAIHDGTNVIGPVDRGVQRIPFRNVKGGWLVK